MTRRRRLALASLPLLLLRGLGAPAEPPRAAIVEAVWTSTGSMPALLRAAPRGFFGILDPRSAERRPRLLVVDTSSDAEETLVVDPPGGVHGLVLHDADSRGDGGFVASAEWAEGGRRAKGLVFIDRDGHVEARRAWDGEIGRIAVLDNGWVAAAVLHAEPRENGVPALFDVAWFDGRTGDLRAQTNVSAAGARARSPDAREMLRLRGVAPVPGGTVHLEPRIGHATWMRVPDAAALRARTGRALPDRAESAWFRPPEEGGWDVLDIAPLGTGDRPEYVVAWTRRGRAPTLLASYGSGVPNEALSVVSAPPDLVRLFSDGRRPLILSGGEGGWRVEELVGR